MTKPGGSSRNRFTPPVQRRLCWTANRKGRNEGRRHVEMKLASVQFDSGTFARTIAVSIKPPSI
jgi:hypothetical protein